MANLKTDSEWREAIRQIETGDKVIGGPDAPINQIFAAIASRTQWLKEQYEESDRATTTALNAKAPATHAHTIADITELQDALDGKLGEEELKAATTEQAGIVQLSSATDRDDEDRAATSKAVKAAFDRAAAAEGKGLPLGAVVAFPRAVSNPTGHLKADGSSFDAATYPDLYKALGNTNRLPDLRRSDVGMTAYFAVDAVPEGWLAFDDIAAQVTAEKYPELHALLIKQYGSIDAVPKAADRFVRNASGGLMVGQTQEDDIKRHNHKLPTYFGPSSGSWTPSQYTDWVRSNEYFVLAYDSGVGDNGWGCPTNAESYTGGDETRPKSLILKLCIKAQNSLDDVQFWVKAYGSVTNAGSLDAATLAQSVQDCRTRIDHAAQDLLDRLARAEQERLDAARELHNAVAAGGVQYQTIGDFDIRRFGDGTMIQTLSRSIYDMNRPNPAVVGKPQTVTFPVAFVAPPTLCLTQIGTAVTVRQEQVPTATAFAYVIAQVAGYGAGGSSGGTVDNRIVVIAIGRWK